MLISISMSNLVGFGQPDTTIDRQIESRPFRHDSSSKDSHKEIRPSSPTAGVATQLEEQFTILPMQAFCDKIYNLCTLLKSSVLLQVIMEYLFIKIMWTEFQLHKQESVLMNGDAINGAINGAPQAVKVNGEDSVNKGVSIYK
jgi:hypothetical protein